MLETLTMFPLERFSLIRLTGRSDCYGYILKCTFGEAEVGNRFLTQLQCALQIDLTVIVADSS